MKAPLPRRFYKSAAAVAAEGGGFAVQLDGRPVRTPGKALLLLPTQDAAALVAAEFEVQAEVIDPVSMPVLRLVNTTIDGVAADPQAVLEDVLRFASSDLLCYRADSPQGLVERQNASWDPVLDWAQGRWGRASISRKASSMSSSRARASRCSAPISRGVPTRSASRQSI